MSTLTKKAIGFGTATLAAATIGATLAAAPAQAANLTGTVAGIGFNDITGDININFADAFVNGNDKFNFLDGMATLQSLSLDNTGNVDGNGDKIYSYQFTDAFMTFKDVTTPVGYFDLFGGFAKVKFDGTTLKSINFDGLAGNINDDNDQLFASVTGTLNTSIEDGNASYQFTLAEPVPEPLTILGSGLALGFGAMFKRQRSKKEDGIA